MYCAAETWRDHPNPNDRHMNNDDTWLLPEGIEELLPPQATQLEALRRRLLDCYCSWGYELVMPPFVEYLDSLLTGTGGDLELQTFKVTDPLTGRLLGVRADMTPQAARIDAHQLRRDAPVRLCYLGTVLHTHAEEFSRSRAPLQVGAELYGHGGIESDLEIIELTLETLAITDVRDPHVDLGHVGIFRGLARQAGLSESAEGALFDALQRKAVPEVDAFLQEQDLDRTVAAMLARLASLNGNEEVFAEAREALAKASPDVHEALAELEAVAGKLRQRHPQLPLHFDLAELRGYKYQTGIVFAAFVPGHGQEVARGGRYDDIGRVFGRARPATGFSADLKTLVALSAAPPQAATLGILAPASDEAALRARVTALRAGGERVVYALPGQSAGGRAMGCDRELVQKDGEWIVTEL